MSRGSWLTIAVVAVMMLVFAVTSIKCGEPINMEWSEMALFVAAVAGTAAVPYSVNRATFKHAPTNGKDA